MDQYLSNSWRLLWKKQGILFWIPGVISFALAIIGMIAAVGTVVPSMIALSTYSSFNSPSSMDAFEAMSGFFGFMIVFYILAAVVGAFIHSANLNAQERLIRGEDMTAGDYFRGLTRCPGRLILLWLATFGLVMGAYLGAILVFILLGMIHVSMVIIGGIAAFAVALYLITKLYTLDTHLVADDAGALECFKLAWTFSKGRAGKIWALIGLSIAIAIVGSLVNQMFSFVTMGSMGTMASPSLDPMTIMSAMIPTMIGSTLVNFAMSFFMKWLEVAKMNMVIAETYTPDPMDEDDLLEETTYAAE